MRREHSWMMILLAMMLASPVLARDTGEGDREGEGKGEMTTEERGEGDGDAADPMVRGRSLLQQGRFEEAAKLFDAMTQEDAEQGEAWFNLGWAVHALGRYNDAVGIHQKAAMFPEWKPSALYNLASAYGSIGMTNHALGALEQARKAGFNDLNILSQDPAMAAVRKHKRFVKPRTFEVKRLFAEDGELTVLSVEDGDGGDKKDGYREGQDGWDGGDEGDRREAEAEYVDGKDREEKADEDEGGLAFAIQTPHGYDESRSYPVLLAFAPGGSVQGGFNSYWGEAAATRDWIVVSPATPEGGWNTDSANELLAGLIEAIRSQYNVEGEKIHVTGASDSATTAFHCAIEHPEACHTLTVFPGTASDDDAERLDRLKGVKVTLFVGEHDQDYLEMARATQDRLGKCEVKSKLEIVEGSDRQIRNLLADNFMEFMEGQRVTRR